MKKILGIVAILLSLASPVSAQVFSQNQVILAPYGGVIYATSTNGNSKLSATTSPTVNWITATSTTRASTFPLASSTALTVSGNAFLPSTSFTGITGLTQCLHVDTNGSVSGTGSDCASTIGNWATSSEQYYWSVFRDLSYSGGLSPYLSPTSTTVALVVPAASSTISNLRSATAIITNGTTTNATSTNLFATTASTTNLFASTIGIATTSPGSILSIQGVGNFVANSTSTLQNGIQILSGCYLNPDGYCVGTDAASASAFKQAVKYATTGALPSNTYNNGVSGVGATITEIGSGALSIDSNSPAVGDRVLIKNESTGANNGIYTVTAAGSGIASFVLTRSTDANTNLDIYPGVSVYVISGTSNSDTVWTMTSAAPITIGTTALTWTESSVGTNAVPTSRNINTTSPITGGGALSADLTLAWDFSTSNVWTGLNRFSGGFIANNASSTFVGSVNITGNSTTTNSTTTIGSFTTASTTNFVVSSIPSALIVTNSSGTAAAYGGTTCTNQFQRSLSALGVGTCATVGASDVSLATLTATDNTLTFSGSYNGSTNRTAGINLATGNIWTAASSTYTGGLTIGTSTTTSATTTNIFSTTASSTSLFSSSAGIASTTPFAGLSVGQGNGSSTLSILVAENRPATSTSMTVNWLQGNQQLVRIGNAGITISFSNYSDGQTLKILTCNPPTGTAGTITWGTQVLWTGGTAPTQTTTATHCDVWSFIATQATSTLKIFGAQTANF